MERLKALQQLNAIPGFVNKDIYRILYKEELYIIAYESIKSNPGGMTKGVDGKNLDGFCMDDIQGIIKDMRDESFRFDRTKRVRIPKPNGRGERPIGIAISRDKIVQQAILMILETIFDSPIRPYFKRSSNGFRRNLGCHSALKEVRGWHGTKWFVEGDIKGCFDNIDHDILLKCITKKIQDQRFLRLIRKSLKAGYLEGKQAKDSIIGTTQGSILSPILANIYLHELDAFMKKIRNDNYKGAKRKVNPEYKRLGDKITKRTKRLNNHSGNQELIEEIRELKKKRIKIPSRDTLDPNFRRVRYVRYADDWLVSVIGPKKLAIEVKEKVSEFLRKELKLELSEEKTKVTHATSERAKFLGAEIYSLKESDVRKMARLGVSFKKRTASGQTIFQIPIMDIIKRFNEKGLCHKNGFPTSTFAWTNLDDDQIITRFNSINRGYWQYYSFVSDSTNLHRIQYILRYACAKTLAHKHKTEITKVFKKHGKELRIKKGEKEFFFKNYKHSSRKKGFSVNEEKIDRVNVYYYHKLTKSSLNSPCVICLSKERIEMHHVKHLRRIGEKYDSFTRKMGAINRKQIPVCKKCHVKIHSGKYDGISLKERHKEWEKLSK